MPSSPQHAASDEPSGTSPTGRSPWRVELRLRARRRLDRRRAVGDARWGRPRTDHRPVYLIAPAGHPNHGDEQLLAGWLRHLRHRLPGTPVVVDCHTPGQAAVLHHSEHPDVLFTDTLWRLAAECPDADAAVEFGRRAVADPGVRPAVASGIELALSASVVHLIGGGYVNDQWPHHLGVAAAAGEVGRRSGARVVATGQGLVPCGDVARLADALRDYDLVAVRDTASLDLLTGTGTGHDVPVRLVGDDGWLALSTAGGLESVADGHGLIDHPAYSSDPDTCRDLVLCAQSDLADPHAVAETVARVLADWAVPGERMSVVEAIPGGDRVVWDLVCARETAASHDVAGGGNGDDDDEVGRALAALQLHRARFVPFQEVWAEGLPARPGQTWLTTRFHPHLFAAARGASGVALRTGSGYYDVKHGSLVSAGSPWPAIGLADEAAPDVPDTGGFDPETVTARVRAAESLAEEIYPLR
ncbi:polysaccharide pyruvyl transferase family protein [Rhodococcus sp. IEGM 1408]|uniref:polysaccharide pyruvyl transferase family protein n=1 Tax=Rhodococcus sp. IEGM 1408 TaxID=3082220 RepID=UPI00295578CC|nr:polysaccharide pyruvyl transferase family protein [Rhodococcus sp. IEGM 1408]MDV8002124.1 polysaccharide pyruvyl transferase family protein [Rhodococcus sp. IEGM 1408]